METSFISITIDISTPSIGFEDSTKMCRIDIIQILNAIFK